MQKVIDLNNGYFTIRIKKSVYNRVKRLNDNINNNINKMNTLKLEEPNIIHESKESKNITKKKKAK